MTTSALLSLDSKIVTAPRNRFLGALAPDDFDLVVPHLAEAALVPGSLLHEPGQAIKRVCFPCSGLVSLLAILPEGHAIDTVTIGRDGAIGLGAALGSPIPWTRAVVQLPGRALEMPATRVAELADRSRSLRAAIARYGDILTGQVQQTVVCNTVLAAPAHGSRRLLLG